MSFRFSALLALAMATSLAFCTPALAEPEPELHPGPSISDAWIREAPPGARALAGFMRIESAVDERLIDARSDVAERVEIHTHLHEDGVMKMRRIADLELPAGELVELRPGGLHLMLIAPTRELRVDERVALVLVFENAGEVEVEALVRPGRRASRSH